jgi:peptidoglycan/xylan/chitin deacetylase (PgdA/CDA1 family)
MVPILTYHSQNIRGNTHADNDHVALREDLAALAKAGKRIIPLDLLVDWLDGAASDESVADAVVLTFDDGCDFDVRDIEYPGHGLQRSFLSIMEDAAGMRDHSGRFGIHATSFVIASRDARTRIDAGSLFGKGWISDDWWRSADANPRLSIENHGWDHNHPDLEGDSRGNFRTVDTHEQCVIQVVSAAETIESHSGRRPAYFAYPFGESSRYIREVFFPEFREIHGCRAALGTQPGHVRRDTNRWNFPRYVCGRDWNSASGLEALL